MVPGLKMHIISKVRKKHKNPQELKNLPRYILPTPRILVGKLFLKRFQNPTAKNLKVHQKLTNNETSALRALREAALTWGDVHEWYLTAAIHFADDFGGWTGFGANEVMK